MQYYTVRIKQLTPMNWFVVLLIVSIALALGLPPDPHSLHQLHITSTAYRLAIAALIIPYAIIWYAAFYAVAKIQEYAKPLKGKDGIAFRQLTIGMWALAFTLTIPTIISLVLQSVAVHNPGFKSADIIISNYISMAMEILAFLLIGRGSRTLLRTIRGWSAKADLRRYAPVFIVLAVSFTYLTAHTNYEYHTYKLNLWILLITLVAPYIYGWMLGLLAAYELRLYSQWVAGTLYQRAIRRFAYGLGITIFGAIAVQFIAVTITQSIDNSVGAILLVDYILLSLVAIGLLTIASGTKALKKIEEV